MLPNLATMLANKFRSKNIRGMFVHTQNIFANICCSIECCPTNSGQKMFVTCLYMLKTFSRTFVVRSNVAQFGHHVGQQIQVKKYSWHVCTCSKHFREHLLFDRMLPNLATMLANKFRSKNVRGMFVHAQNIFANICCSIECCLIWPLCSRTIQLS